MQVPVFFHDLPKIRMYDPLAEFLGMAANGILTYSYEDAAKLSGHSCPTVAGAYLMIRRGLDELYREDVPVRGEIRVFFKEEQGEGTVGVTANVASMITGAAGIGGFRGIGEKYDRRNLMTFGADIDGEMALERSDTAERVVMRYNPGCIPADPKMTWIMEKIFSQQADHSIRRNFAELWQERVRKILIDYRDDPRLIQCQSIKRGENG